MTTTLKIHGYRTDMALTVGASCDIAPKGYDPELWRKAREARASDLTIRGNEWIGTRWGRYDHKQVVLRAPVDMTLPEWEVGDISYADGPIENRVPYFWRKYRAATAEDAAALHVSHDAQGRNWTVQVRPVQN